MSEKVLFLLSLVVVLAFSGTVQAATPLDVNNYSFEYDCDGNQIQREVPPASGCIKGWTNSGNWFGATMWCGSPLYTGEEQCQNVGATDGEVAAWIQNTNIYAYQVTDNVFEAAKRYTITFDAQGWGATFTPSFFYPEDPCFPDVNHIEVGSEAMLIDSEVPAGPNMWDLDVEAEFTSLPDYDYIGKQIGIKFFNGTGGGYVFFDNVRLSWDWATKAYEPNPEDGSDEIDKDVVLEWRPGLWAANVDGHEVYFGTSFAEVNDANSNTAGVYRGPASVGSYADPCDANLTIYTYDPPETLELVKTYYWRIDEVNESYSGSTPPTPPSGRWKGDVWSFEVEGRAKEPYPAHMAADVAVDVVLHWTPGRDAASHDVYFGTDETAVSSATTSSTEFMGNQGPNTFDSANYDANGLEFAREYFWRIDEVSALTAKGATWSFSVPLYSVVEDFEYVTTPALLAVWDDYWVNDTGAELTRESLPEFVRDGNSAMYDYANTTKTVGRWVGSVASADIVDLEIGPDWTKSGIRALVLYFLGKEGNAVGVNDRMWVELEDTSSNAALAIYDGNPNDVAIPEWHEWNIDLSVFDACGVSLANIDKIHLGFGGQLRTGQSAIGGTGTVWFDDIGVHPRRCVPAYSKSKGDFDGDCTPDMLDTRNLARDWLESGGPVSATQPTTEPVLWFKFDEGSGTTTANSGSLGTGRNGTLIGMSVDPWRSPGAPVPDVCDPNHALEFDGTNDYVTSPNMGIVTDELTVSAWLKRTADEFIFAGVLIVPGANDFNAMSGMQFGSTPDWKTTNTINYVWESAIETWGWESDLLVPDSQWTFAAVVVEPTQATIWMHDGTEMSSAINFFDHGAVTFSRETYMGLNPKRNNKGAFVRFYEGQIDDVRVYDYALSQGEVLYLVDHEGSFYQPLEEWRSDADGDDKVDLIDYAYMGDNWLKEILWPEP